jgi:hypothetical protein
MLARSRMRRKVIGIPSDGRQARPRSAHRRGCDKCVTRPERNVRTLLQSPVANHLELSEHDGT